jgi:hypothetical protein
MQDDTRTAKSNTEALKTNLATVPTDTASTKSQVGLMVEGLAPLVNRVGALQADVDALQANTASIQQETAATRGGVTAIQESVGPGLTTQLAGVQSNLGTPPSGHSLYTAFMASRRYSRTCDPATDTWLRSAWPGLSDSDIKSACLRDGRWHYLGTMREYITGGLAFPEGMQVGLSSYAQNIKPATVNEWVGHNGVRLCVPVVAVGNIVTGDSGSAVHECIAAAATVFGAGHHPIDGTAPTFILRDYRGYTGGNESTLPCNHYSNSGTRINCGTPDSVASFWKVYVRQ